MKKTLIPVLLLVFIVSCNGSGRQKTPQLTDAAASEKTDRDTIVKKDSAVQSPQINVQGIDVSHHQVNIQWDSLTRSDIAFIFIKATGGLDYTDPEFQDNWENAKEAGLLRGAYHFYYATDDPEKQAEFFSKTVLPVWNATDLPPVLDLETHGVNPDIAVDQYQNNVKKWLEFIEKTFKRKPVIYTSTNFANTYLQNNFFNAYHLWLAEYEVESPVVPETWKATGWTFWQKSYSDTIPGIQGGVDHNIFAGNIKALQELGH